MFSFRLIKQYFALDTTNYNHKHDVQFSIIFFLHLYPQILPESDLYNHTSLPVPMYSVLSRGIVFRFFQYFLSKRRENSAEKLYNIKTGFRRNRVSRLVLFVISKLTDTEIRNVRRIRRNSILYSGDKTKLLWILSVIYYSSYWFCGIRFIKVIFDHIERENTIYRTRALHRLYYEKNLENA